MSSLRRCAVKLFDLNRSSMALAAPVRFKTHKRSGAFMPEPPRTPFGMIGVICTVVPGLLIGATISKYIASFLEENDLFVPSDDDDDDD
ncbi:PREDICTED: protein EMRE homolog, mitochondrial [Nicrophorus vespilloides]|uniref:Essential MCU regulator, mitochondrial n=1 Tax=Nicrophorus vespilloides TaxID=110193 RepID=A0ABM1MN50_NICVS|nr:PREDICTED: protein EMRE homolog, mitochondrial [Nicrophorus vespilloides]